jgi:outer membrane immunogenic protein
MLRTLAIATTAVALMSGAAFAADLSVPETPYVPESTGFSWDGLYAGVGVGGYFAEDLDTQAEVSGVFGVNTSIDNFVLGAELEGVYAFDANDQGDFYEFWVKGRAGYLITPSVLVYGVAGVGVWDYTDSEQEGGSTQFALGLGIEAAVSDSISLRGEVLGVRADGSDTTDAEAKVSVLFHF